MLYVHGRSRKLDLSVLTILGGNKYQLQQSLTQQQTALLDQYHTITMSALSIAIDFEKEKVSAGTHFRGKVVLVATKEISAKEILVTLNGAEITKVEWTEYRESNGSRESFDRWDEGYRSFLAVEIPVQSFPVVQNCKVLPGSYEVPFDVELPEHIPSSFSVKARGSECCIQYHLKVQLRGSGNLWDYKETKEVQVRGKSLPRAPMPFVSEPVDNQVKFCCCINRGNIMFGTKVLDTRLDKGEACNIHLSIRNNSTLDIKKVGARLYQVIYFEGRQAKPCTVPRDLGTFQFPKLAGLPKSKDGNNEFDQLKRVFEEIEQGTHSAEIAMPADAIASYNGSMIKVTHHLHIYVEAGSCVSPPEVEVPILCGEVPPADETAQEDTAPAVNGVVVPSTNVNVGGLPTESDDPDLIFNLGNETNDPSVDTLLSEMKASLTDLQLVEGKLKDPAWDGVFQVLKPDDITKVVKQVDMDFDQPRIAKLIAEKMDKFTCAHALAAVK